MQKGARSWAVVGLGFAAVGLAAAPGGVAAQRAELVPQLGFFTPLASMGTAETEGGETLTLGERERGFAYGLSVQFGGAVPAGVRGTVLFGTGSDVPVDGPGCEQGCTLDNNLRLITGALVIRPLPSLILLRPYLLAGGGWKRFGFDEAELAELGLQGAVSDQTRTAWQVGVGLELSVGLSAIVVELNDFISGFEVEEERGEGKTQHDLFLTVGLRL